MTRSLDLGKSLLRAVLVAAMIPACQYQDPFHHVAGGAAPSNKILVASGTIGAAGGTVSVSDPNSPDQGVGVVIPAGALPAAVNITIERYLSGSPYPEDVMTYDFGPSGTVFTTAVTVTLPYSAALLADHRVTDPSTLQLVETTAAPVTKETLLTTAQDIPHRLISGKATHFCTFAVLAFSEPTL